MYAHVFSTTELLVYVQSSVLYTVQMPAGADLGTESWVPVLDIRDEKPVMINRSTQTDRFYPSAQTLGMRREAAERQLTIQATARDRLRKLNTFSPGKG